MRRSCRTAQKQGCHKPERGLLTMTIREETQAIERQTLSRYATLSQSAA